MTTLKIQMYPQYIFSGGLEYCLLYYQAVEVYQQPFTETVVLIGSPQDPAGTPYPVFTDANSALTYYQSDFCDQLVTNVNTSIGSTFYTDYTVSLTAPAVNSLYAMLATVARTGKYSDLIGDPVLASVATSGAYGDLSGKPALAAVATSGAYVDLSGKPSIPTATSQITNDSGFITASSLPLAPYVYQGATKRTNGFPAFYSGTVASGVVTFNLTTDGTSTGGAIFPNGVIAESINAFVSDATASYQMSYALSNFNKTISFTVNKLTTANILTGLLGQTAANGSVVRACIWGY